MKATNLYCNECRESFLVASTASLALSRCPACGRRLSSNEILNLTESALCERLGVSKRVTPGGRRGSMRHGDER